MAPAEGLSILNVGFGLGIVDRLFQGTRPRAHVIIEAHPQVLQHMRDTGVYAWPHVTVLEGRWQDFCEGEGLERLMDAAGGGFDAIFVDTFAEGYEGESRRAPRTLRAGTETQSRVAGAAADAAGRRPERPQRPRAATENGPQLTQRRPEGVL